MGVGAGVRLVSGLVLHGSVGRAIGGHGGTLPQVGQTGATPLNDGGANKNIRSITEKIHRKMGFIFPSHFKTLGQFPLHA